MTQATLRSWIATAGLTVAVIALWAAVAETAARSHWAADWLPSPVIGSNHRSLDIKFAFLDRWVRAHHGVDCLFVGASSVDRGIDPETFARAYKARTGKDIHCFNFGISGTNLSSLLLLSRLLVDRYHPRLLILGTLPASESQGGYNEKQLKQSRWIEYQRGVFSMEGWLIEQSMAFRYFLRFRVWLERPDLAQKLEQAEAGMSENGYSKLVGSKVAVAKLPDRRREARGYRKFRGFELAERHLEALDRLLAMCSELELLVAEVPAHPSFWEFLPRGIRDRAQILAATTSRADRHGVLFWPSDEFGPIPDQAWHSRVHLNDDGAQIFSRWLGDRVAEAVASGRLANPVIYR